MSVVIYVEDKILPLHCLIQLIHQPKYQEISLAGLKYLKKIKIQIKWDRKIAEEILSK